MGLDGAGFNKPHGAVCPLARAVAPECRAPRADPPAGGAWMRCCDPWYAASSLATRAYPDRAAAMRLRLPAVLRQSKHRARRMLCPPERCQCVRRWAGPAVFSAPLRGTCQHPQTIATGSRPCQAKAQHESSHGVSTAPCAGAPAIGATRERPLPPPSTAASPRDTRCLHIRLLSLVHTLKARAAKVRRTKASLKPEPLSHRQLSWRLMSLRPFSVMLNCPVGDLPM